LPLVLVDGVPVLTGRYPTQEMLSRYAGLARTPSLTLTPVASQGCCGGATSNCC